MPVSPSYAENVSVDVVATWAEAERLLLEHIGRALAKDLDAPNWAEVKLLQMQLLQAQAAGIVDKAAARTASDLAVALVKAYNRGAAGAVIDLQDLVTTGLPVAPPPPGLPAVEKLVSETIDQVQGTRTRILRATMDAYRDVIRSSAPQVLLGSQTRRQAAQTALDRFAARGITGFIDKAGRGWSLESYVSMATRTAASRAAVQGHTDRLLDAGEDLVIVSNAPQECKLCLVPGTVVEGPVPTGRTRSEYTGDVIRIVTASGNDLTGTPDHPVLTPRGWVALKDLHPGDQVISHDREQGYPGVVPDDVQVPALIEEAGEAFAPLLLAGPTRRDLDQDVSYREVRAVLPDGLLLDERHPALVEPLCDLLLVGGVGPGAHVPGLSNPMFGLGGSRDSSACVMCRIEHGGSLLGSGIRPTLDHARAGHGGSFLMGLRSGELHDSVMARPGLYAGAAQVVADPPAADAEGGAELLRSLSSHVSGDEFLGLLGAELPGSLALVDRRDSVRSEMGDGLPVADVEGGHELLESLAGSVAFDEVVDVGVSHYSGHVWDLSTEPAWFIANGIVTHNCRPLEGKILSLSGVRRVDGVDVWGTLDQARGEGLFHPNCRHSTSLYLPGVTKAPTRTADPEGDVARQKLRYLERQTRAAKRTQAVALDPAAERKAGALVRARQAQIREHVANSPAKRISAREQIGRAT